MDSVNTRIDSFMKDVQSVKSSLEFTQAQVEELITPDLRVKKVKVQIEDLGNKLDELEKSITAKWFMLWGNSQRITVISTM